MQSSSASTDGDGCHLWSPLRTERRTGCAQRNSKYQRVSQAGARHKSQIVTLIVADPPNLPACTPTKFFRRAEPPHQHHHHRRRCLRAALSHPSKCNVNFFVRAIAYVKTTTKRSMPDRVATTCQLPVATCSCLCLLLLPLSTFCW